MVAIAPAASHQLELALDGDDGSALWAKVLASNDLSALFTTAVTPGGNIAIGGSFRGTMELAKVHSANAATHAYVALLAYDGTPLWSHAGGGSNSGDSAEIRALVTDADGKVYAAGSTTTGLSFDNVSQPGKGGGNDAWVAQFVK